jgi:hypothetical protein
VGKRRNKSNPWFKRRTLVRGAVDVMRRAGTPMTAREIAEALIAGKPLRPPQADHRPTGGYPCCLPAQWRPAAEGVGGLNDGSPARWQITR